MSNGDWQHATNIPPSNTPPYVELDHSIDQSKWPSVFGTISIILGSLGLLCYGCGTIDTAGTNLFANMMPPEQRPAPTPAVQVAVQTTQMCLTWLLSGWLLAAGIGLLKRRRWARGHHLGWAAGKIIMSILGAAIGLVFLDDSVKQINDQLSKQGTPPFTITRELMIIIMIVFTVWFLMYPAILLIFLSRQKIKNEVSTWT